MELIDVLNTAGQPTGQSKTRREIHRDGDLHLAIEICLINDKNQILIQKRSAIKDSHPNLWEISCSGHVDAGETSIQAALRELQEELGITTTQSDLTFIQRFFEPSITQKNYINNEFKDLYLLYSNKPISEFSFPEAEISALRWVDLLEFISSINQKNPHFAPHPVGYPILFNALHENKNPA